MTPPMKKKHNRQSLCVRHKGFTLLELLVAMTIVSMIMVIIFSGFYLGVNSWKKGERSIDRQQRLRVVLDQFEQEIRSAFFLQVRCSSDDLSSQKAIAINADSSKLSFITVTQGLIGDPTKKASLRMVSYYVNSQDDEKAGFVVEEYQNYINFFYPERSESKVYQLDPSITDISFRYYRLYKDPDKVATNKGLNMDDLNKEEQEKGEWVDSWDPCKEIEDSIGDNTEGSQANSEETEYSKWIGAIEIKLTTEEENGEESSLLRVIPIYAGMKMTKDSKL